VIPLSILDLVPITLGSTPRAALRNSLDLVQHAERFGYNRYWVAEHHNLAGIGSAATSVVMGYLASGTQSIRIGSGGVMLPNHSPLIVAEQFGTLASLYPGRIDLGVGRAPGTDMRTLRALRRSPDSAETFPRDVQELQALLAPVEPGQLVQAIPGGGTEVPIWILGSSTFGARLAGLLGLPYAFASHFAPGDLKDALHAYRACFSASKHLTRPYIMLGVNVVAADTDEAARYHFTTVQQSFTNRLRGQRSQAQPPIDDIEVYWTPAEKAQVAQVLVYSFVGAPDTVYGGLHHFIEWSGADELLVSTHIFDHKARVRSYEILMEVMRRMDRDQTGNQAKAAS
jgi:luciferase family oxidoreductase group 1